MRLPLNFNFLTYSDSFQDVMIERVIFFYIVCYGRGNSERDINTYSHYHFRQDYVMQ